ncbi:AAA family ATPase [Exiguobacterium sp. 17-1]|uniref:AAA family ATPase n=1 Tax=Exiguobacterium sp. 17-1 TaxID=2931981 RepID=UPI001FFE7C2A|nr:AAA family ATPase [Exiguobacterium sp. 17-1]MCK2156415.1 AAA family ATPase [Exiguobacterium sp. 17-1]
MKLKWIEITNFKQFYGTHRVIFADSDNENVTVVYGENGKGKTTIYRAFIYAFHGDKRLERDGQLSKNHKSGNEIYHIGNTAALEENGYVDVSVRVAYEHEGKYYEIKRSMVATQEGKVIEEADLESETYLKITENGLTDTFRDIDEINKIAEEALSKRMRQYFLFDGEQIEEMTKSTLEQRRQVKDGIKKLLGVDSLYSTIETIEKIVNDYKKKIKNQAKGEHLIALEKLEKIDQEKESMYEEIQKLEFDIERMKRDKEEINEYLEKNSTVRKKVEERERAEELLKSLEKSKESLVRSVKEAGSKSIFSISEVLLKSTQSNIKMEFKNLGESFNISYGVLKEFLTKETCGVCGTPAVNGSIEYLKIENLLDNINESEYREALNELNLNVAIVHEKVDESKSHIHSLRDEISKLLIEIKSVKKNIPEIDQEIRNFGDQDAKEKEWAREKIIRKMGETDAKINILRQKLVENREERNIQKLKTEELRKLEASRSIYEDYKEFAERSLKELLTVKAQFTEEMAKQISNVSTRIFKQLLDKDSRMNFNEVIVKEDFSLDITSYGNFEFLSNISSGQRHILSISFILALLEISEGKGNQLKTPLFMDTPFGRISGENRDNLLKTIPQKAAQWILLVTDTEFTSSEVSALRPTNRWGKLYEIKLIGPGKAIIEEGNVKTFVPKR